MYDNQNDDDGNRSGRAFSFVRLPVWRRAPGPPSGGRGKARKPGSFHYSIRLRLLSLVNQTSKGGRGKAPWARAERERERQREREE